MKATILNLGINNIKSIRSAIEKICETKVISNKNEFNNVINSIVMKEAKEDPVYGRGFFIPKQKIKAPSFDYGGKVM